MGTWRRLLLVCACGLLLFPVGSALAATPPDTLPPGGAVTTTALVASEAPVPQVPRVGPFRGAAGETGVRAAWWLLVIGGAQVVALVLVTRRSRARLPLRDDAP